MIVCIYYCYMYVYIYINSNYWRGCELERRLLEVYREERKDENDVNTVPIYETLKNKELRLTSF